MFLFTVLAGLILPMGALAHSDDEVFGGHMFGSGMWGGWMLMIIFWIIGITLFILFIKWFVDQGRRKSRQDRMPLDILKERYAKGELDKDQFEKMKKDLQ